MKKKLLGLALCAGIGMAQSAAAQSYDDRWYIGAGVGVGFFDSERAVSDDLYGMIGFGKMFTEHWSLDAELWHSNPDLNDSAVIGTFPDDPISDIEVVERNWELLSLSVVGRYHFMTDNEKWHPYVALGLGAQEHHDGTQRQPLALGFSPSRTGTDVVALLGVGAQWDLGYPYLRAEAGARIDMDDADGDSNSNFVDGYLGFEFIFPIGPEAAPPPPPPPPPEKTCADLDDDGDGVNNCDDKCPGTAAGTGVGPDGCPVPPPEPPMEPKPYRN